MTAGAAEVMGQGETDGLFDPAPYTIPKLDGHVADKVVLAFGGSVELDRLVEDDLEMLEKLRLGQDATLTIQATVAAKGFTHSVNAKEEEQVGYAVRLRVHSVESG
jgi:hypothetical protein